MPAWEAQGNALSLRVRVTPNGGRDAVDGLDTLADGREVLKLRVRAAPDDGAANDAVLRMLAKALGVAPSAVSLLAGATARLSPSFDSRLISFIFVAVAVLSFASFAAKEPVRR